MSNNQDSELNEIMEGFRLFGSETGGIINPKEIKEIMEIMNMNEKNPFLYDIISKLCTNENIQGVNAENFISLLDQEFDDISTIEDLQKIFSIFSDNNTNKISLSMISQILSQDIDWDLGQDEEKIKKLISKPEIGGKQIDFDEFQDIMKTEKDKTNMIYMKKSNINLNHKNNKYNDNEIINNNNFNINNFQDSNSPSDDNLNINDNSNINLKNNIKNTYEKENNEIKQEINNNINIKDLNYNNDINNFDSVNQDYKSDKSKQQKSSSKKKYRYTHKSSEHSEEKENQKEEKEANNISYKYQNNNEKIKNTDDDFKLIKEDEKMDKTNKRYHRRYRDIKSPPKKQKEENLYDKNNIGEIKDNKVSNNYWRYRGKK